MLTLMSDAFADAVNDARRRLELREGRTISVNELARRAGIPRANLHHHLNPNRTVGRRVPAELVRALAAVLPIDEAELARAAQIASGFTVREDSDELPDLRGMLVRYVQEEPDREARMRTIAEVQRIMAEEMARVLAEGDGR